jgi:hypothetical protein
MNELSRHIEILMLTNDCVIVPGFGGFMAHHKVAEYMKDSSLFYPPQRTMGFNPQLQLNDSLLAQAYVEAYDISYPEAIRRIENEVDEIKQILSVEGEYEFHGIGTIRLLSDGRYDFEPCQAGLLTPSLYALNSFDFEMLEKQQDKITITFATPKVIAMPIRRHMTVIRRVMTAAAVLILVMFAFMPSGNSGNVQMSSIFNVEMLNALTSSVEKSVESTNATEVKAPAKVVAKSKAVELTHPYVLVLASKVGKSGAEDMVARLAGNGFKQARIHQSRTMRKVIYGNYSSEEEAVKALHALRAASNEFAYAWVDEI